MPATVQAPIDIIESFATFRLPPDIDEKLRDLMDRNNEGQLSAQERVDLASLAELSEKISIMRAGALSILGRRP